AEAHVVPRRAGVAAARRRGGDRHHRAGLVAHHHATAAPSSTTIDSAIIPRLDIAPRSRRRRTVRRVASGAGPVAPTTSPRRSVPGPDSGAPQRGSHDGDERFRDGSESLHGSTGRRVSMVRSYWTLAPKWGGRSGSGGPRGAPPPVGSNPGDPTGAEPPL